MSRKEMFVDAQKLKLVVDQLEEEQVAGGAPPNRPFRSRNELHKAVANTDWGQAIGISPVVVALRIERYGIECKTSVRSRATTVTGTDSEDGTSQAPQRRSVYRGIDLDGFLAPFLERGLEVNSLTSIMTSSVHTRGVNLKIQAAWHDLRERFNIPQIVRRRPGEIESVLPLDQVRLPGDEMDESIPVYEPMLTEVVSEVVEDLPTDEVLVAEEFPEFYESAATEEYDPNAAPVDPLSAGWDEEVYDETQPVEAPAGPFPEPGLYQNDWPGWDGEQSDETQPVYDETQPVYDEFYDPATDEAGLEQVQNAIDQIEQEGGVYTQAPESEEPFTREDLAQVRDDLEAIWDDSEVVSEAGMQTEFLPPIEELLAGNSDESGVTLDQEPYLDELPLEESVADPVQGETTENDWTREFEAEYTDEPQLESALYDYTQPEEGEFHAELQGDLQEELDGDYAVTGEDIEGEFVGDFRDEFQVDGETLQDAPQDAYQEPEVDVAQEFEEWLATGEPPMDEHQELYPEGPPPEDYPEYYADKTPAQGGYPESAATAQDEYLPFDFESEPAPEAYGPNGVPADNYDASLFEVEETDPSDTR